VQYSNVSLSLAPRRMQPAALVPAPKERRAPALRRGLRSSVDILIGHRVVHRQPIGPQRDSGAMNSRAFHWDPFGPISILTTAVAGWTDGGLTALKTD
jgi:hypothetical protein